MGGEGSTVGIGQRRTRFLVLCPRYGGVGPLLVVRPLSVVLLRSRFVAVVCPRCWWCVPVAGGVSPLLVVCPRCWWCVPAAGGVSPLPVVCPRCRWCVPVARGAEGGTGVWSVGGWQFPGLCGAAGVG
ncbi:MAG: hypothetical protein ACK6D0_12620, partial [Planctomyces sp.]